jgi:hypothetical protein
VALCAACGGSTPAENAEPPAPVPPPAAPSETAAAPIGRCTSGPEPAGGVVTEAEGAAFEQRGAEVAGILERYGQRFPESFAGVWLDLGFNTVRIAFARDWRHHRDTVAELESRGVLVSVVKAQHTLAELDEIQRQLADDDLDLIPFASFVDLQNNRVQLELGVVDQETLAALGERFPADALCVEVPAPEELVPEGPQPQSGPGWRLLADASGVGTVWDTSAALDQKGYEALWRTLGLDGEPPAVDFGREIVVHFGPAVSGSCSNIRLDGLLFEGDLVLPEIVQPGVQPPACTADANPHTYLVAVERSALPPLPFRVQLEPEPCPGCGGTDVTVIESLG